MQQALLLLAILAQVSCTEWIGGWRTKFKYGIGIGTNFFYDMPRNVSAAKDLNWTQHDRPEGCPLSSLVMYCPESPIVCCLYDDTGYAAGLQVAFPKRNFTEPAFDMAIQGYSNWTVNNEGYYTTAHYYVSEEFLSNSQEERLASRDSNKLIQCDGIWVTGFNGQLLKISNSTDGIKDSTFTEQACMPWMGLHYYYNMTEDTTCTSDSIYPWFPLYDDGQFVGVGLNAFAKWIAISGGERDYFEDPGRTGVETIVTSGPTCLYELADSPGVTTMHTYVVDKPYLILCLNN